MNVIVIKHPTKQGYCLKNTDSPQSWIVGPDQTFGWYKRKVDATKLAAELNTDEIRLRPLNQ